jgi:hypothetical protein
MPRLWRMEMMICWVVVEEVVRLRSSRARFLLLTRGMRYVLSFLPFSLSTG